MSRFGGTADASSTLRALWEPDSAAEARSGRRGGLSRSVVVTTAIELADDPDGAGVSLRAIADRLGCTAMALYTYVHSREQLLDLMYDAVHAELPDQLEQPRGSSTDEAEPVLVWARALVELYVRHPWVVEVSLVRPVLGPHEQQAVELLVGAARASGLSDVHTTTAIFALFGLCRTAAAAITDARRAGTVTGQDDVAWWRERTRVLAEVAPDFADRFPLSTSLGGSTHEGDGDADWAPVEPGGQPVLERAARAHLDAAVRLLLAGAGAPRPPVVRRG